MIEPWCQRLGDELRARHNDPRSPWQRDRGRILHSAAFRRLQCKTQVLGVGDNDFYRTRLTHSLEVAQIGAGIVSQLSQQPLLTNQLLPDAPLIESICLAHDIGHPPFGHGGEIALNYMMREDGGFEGNAQTFRILTKLEPYTREHGMNLTRRTLLGVIKYPNMLSQLQRNIDPVHCNNFRKLKASDWHPAKGIYDDDVKHLEWVMEPLSVDDRTKLMTTTTSVPTEHSRTINKSLDCSIMELADDIAYGVHDLEDAIIMGIIDRDDWQQHVTSAIIDLDDCWLANQISAISEQLFSAYHYDQKNGIGTLVNAFITAIELNQRSEFSDPLLQYNAKMNVPMAKALSIFKSFVMNYVIRTPEIEMARYKGQQTVMALFEAFASDPQRLLPINTRKRWLFSRENGRNHHRVIADYIAGMTDDYAQKTSAALFNV